MGSVSGARVLTETMKTRNYRKSVLIAFLSLIVIAGGSGVCDATVGSAVPCNVDNVYHYVESSIPCAAISGVGMKGQDQGADDRRDFYSLGQAGRCWGIRSRSEWRPPPLVRRPALQLYPFAGAAGNGRGWHRWKRRAVAPPAAAAALAMGIRSNFGIDSEHVAIAVIALWPPQFIPLDRGPLAEGGWPLWKRVDWSPTNGRRDRPANGGHVAGHRHCGVLHGAPYWALLFELIDHVLSPHRLSWISCRRTWHGIETLSDTVAMDMSSVTCSARFDGDLGVLVASRHSKEGPTELACSRARATDAKETHGSSARRRWEPGPRSERPPPPSAGCPASQLDFLADAACIGRGWRWRMRREVAPSTAVAAIATGVVDNQVIVIRREFTAAFAIYPLQFAPRSRGPRAEGGWLSRKRAGWRSLVVGPGGALLLADWDGGRRRIALRRRSIRHCIQPLHGSACTVGGSPLAVPAVTPDIVEYVNGPCAHLISATSPEALRQALGRRRHHSVTHSILAPRKGRHETRNVIARNTSGIRVTRVHREAGHFTVGAGIGPDISAASLLIVLVTLHAAASVGEAAAASHDERRYVGGIGAPKSKGRHRRPPRSKDSQGPQGARSSRGRVALAAIVVRGRRYGPRKRKWDRRGLVLGEAGISSPWWRAWTNEAAATRGEAAARRCVEDARAEHLDTPTVDTCTSWEHRGVGSTADKSMESRCRGQVRGRAQRGGRPVAGRSPHRILPLVRVLAMMACMCRVSDATSSPSSSTGTPQNQITAEWTTMKRATAAVYPAPNRDGFRDVRSPGFSDGVRERSSEDPNDFALVVETVNSTGWGPLQRRLKESDAHIICAQETWVLQGQVKSASDWARYRGWEAIWAPAKLGSGGGASGGVAVFAKRGFGLRFPDHGPHIVDEARAVVAVCEPPGHRALIVCSAYLIDGLGARDPNRIILGKIGDAIEAQGNGYLPLVGADFQCPPPVIDGTGFPSRMGGRILASTSPRGTYRTSTTSSNLDYFVVGGGLAEVVDAVCTVEASGIKSHVPLQVTFVPRPVALKHLMVRQPPPLALERVYGPLPAPQCWAAPREAAGKALRMAAEDRDEQEIQAAIDNAYRLWCGAAEMEVADATGECPKKWGLRGRLPNIKWGSTLPEKKARGAPSEAAIATWLRGAVTELRRVISALDDQAAEGLYVDNARERSYMPHGATFAAPTRGGYGGAGGARTASGRGGRPRPPIDLASCQDIVRDIRNDLGDESGRTTDHDDLVNLWGRAVRIGARAMEAVKGSMRWAHYDDPELKADADLLIADLSAAERAWEARRDAANSRGWREWLEEDWNRGAKRAHAYTKAPVGWAPTAVTTARGILSASPMAILENMREKYSAMWSASETPMAYRWQGSCEELPPLTPEQLREASLSFTRLTAVTYDGWHVRQFALVGDEGLRTLSILLSAVERSAIWPTQTSLVTMPLIGKPRGGYRGIGKLTGLYRIWSKARRSEAVAWEARNDRPFFAASAGAGPVDAVHRQAMRQEAAVASGEAAAVVLEDLEAFYESIDRGRLLEAAREHRFPIPIVRACLAMYAAARMITLDKVAARELYPCRGLIAGCSFATTLVKLFYITPLDRAVTKLPIGTNVDFFIDDIAVTAVGPRREVAARVVEAHALIRKAVTEELGCTLASQKAAIIASSKEVGREVAARLSNKEALAEFAPNLGIDTAAGKRRRCLRTAARKNVRLRTGAARGVRLWAVARSVGRKAIKIFTSGVAPGMLYGTEIWGLDDSETMKLRKIAAVALRPHSKCRSLTLVHLINGMPTAKDESRAAVQYAKAIWRAATNREYAAARGVGLTDLRKQWEEAHAGIAPHVDDYIASAARNGGRAAPRAARKAWANVRGPVGAAALTLARLGWRMTSAFEWKDARGDAVSLTTTSPALIALMLADATRDVAERRMGALWAEDDPSLSGRRICPDLVAKAIRSSGGGQLSALQTAALRAAACDGIYTRSRAVANGYDIEDICGKCGMDGDTVHHRVYKCQHSRDAVLRVVPRWLYEEGGKALPSSRFWTTGLFPHPVDNWPLPAEGFNGIVVGATDEEEGLPGWDDPVTGFGHHLYSDGSGAHGVVRGLSRAGCAVSQVDDSGARIRAIYLPVPRHLPQTSQAGEFVGVAVARRKAARKAEVGCDCANVVRTDNAPLRAALAPTKVYSGIALDRLGRGDDVARCTTVRWVKAHRAEKEDDTWATKRDIRGNASADALAKEAVQLHPQPSAEQQASLDYFARRAPLVAKAIGAALALFPPSETDRLRRRPRALDEAQARERSQHNWQFELGRWRCSICGTWSTSDVLTKKLEAGRCRGHIADAEAAKWTSLGHVMARVSGTAPFAFCRRCGAWGSRRTHNLSKACGAPTPAGKLALRRIAKGKHPWQKRLEGGGMAPRANIVVVGAFDGVSGKWSGVNAGSGRSTKRSRGRDSARGRPAGATARCAAPSGGVGLPPPGPDATLTDGEDDPFGHGGSLEQNDQPNVVHVAAAAGASGGGGTPPGACLLPAVATSAAQPPYPASHAPTTSGSLDAAACSAPCRKRGPTPAVRMEALRDRVKRRVGAARDHGEVDPLPAVTGDPVSARGEFRHASSNGADSAATLAQGAESHRLGGSPLRLRAQSLSPVPEPAADRANSESGGGGRLRADQADPNINIQRQLHHHGSTSMGPQGQCSSRSSSTRLPLPGLHGGHRQHCLEGGVSRCSSHPLEARPLAVAPDRPTGEVADLAGEPTPGLPPSPVPVQVHRRRVGLFADTQNAMVTVGLGRRVRGEGARASGSGNGGWDGDGGRDGAVCEDRLHARPRPLHQVRAEGRAEQLPVHRGPQERRVHCGTLHADPHKRGRAQEAVPQHGRMGAPPPHSRAELVARLRSSGDGVKGCQGQHDDKDNTNEGDSAKVSRLEGGHRRSRDLRGEGQLGAQLLHEAGGDRLRRLQFHADTVASSGIAVNRRAELLHRLRGLPPPPLGQAGHLVSPVRDDRGSRDDADAADARDDDCAPHLLVDSPRGAEITSKRRKKQSEAGSGIRMAEGDSGMSACGQSSARPEGRGCHFQDLKHAVVRRGAPVHLSVDQADAAASCEAWHEGYDGDGDSCLATVAGKAAEVMVAAGQRSLQGDGDRPRAGVAHHLHHGSPRAIRGAGAPGSPCIVTVGPPAQPSVGARLPPGGGAEGFAMEFADAISCGDEASKQGDHIHASRCEDGFPDEARVMRVSHDSDCRHSLSHQYGKHDSRGSSSVRSRAPGTVVSGEGVSR